MRIACLVMAGLSFVATVVLLLVPIETVKNAAKGGSGMAGFVAVLVAALSCALLTIAWMIGAVAFRPTGPRRQTTPSGPTGYPPAPQPGPSAYPAQPGSAPYAAHPHTGPQPLAGQPQQWPPQS
ncbi:hypothetical protein [Actinokineospora iranica]|uniref:Uncharacterized protein n=1 Tax=Actinokineospora iranica TaxID=1271860 RepID=A0A1G6LNI1_9PSEU|nr:hypothetical protein [Actinokineospora iranica]SDC44266.1 hypothetical protein SAMN05216174_102142 [Actinokineospora iranica]